MKELQRKSLATAEFDEILGSHVYSVHDLQGFKIDVLCPHVHTTIIARSFRVVQLDL